jgi:hypothetical protein
MTTTKIPTLTEFRQHIRKYGWNGQYFTSKMSNEMVFAGQCEYASTSLSELLTGIGNVHQAGDWSLRVRGWFSGDLSAILDSPGCDEHAKTEGKHCHSWVEFEGKIIDPTFWQFAGERPRVFVFDINDPRFTKDEEA